MELISILTDKDFGLEPQELVEPKLRNASRGIVIREDGKIAIQYKRNKNQYKLVGGGIEDDEDAKIAFAREVLEETGCEVEIIKELGTLEEYRSQKNFKQISFVYVGKVLKDTKILNLTEKEKDEGAELIWETPENALKLIIDNADKMIASKYENVYSSKFVALRDRKILEYYLANK